jgi:hypothetical protein
MPLRPNFRDLIKGQRMKGLVPLVLTLATSGAQPAMAGAFDGNWSGQIAPTGACRGVATMTITVSGDTLSGLMHNSPRNIKPFKGTVDAEGNGKFTTQLGYPGTIKFTAEHFDANWTSGECQRHSLGDRAPDAKQTAALLAQRAQAQATYDDLTARAAGGDRSVDFTLLRSSYPFTRQWDPDSAASGPIMEQADVAAQGKDCGVALEKTEEVLKVDFTTIHAHRVRSDCLKGDAARIESRIADGMMDSLTHGSDGSSENSAYLVMSRHEEADILARKDILLRTRDVEVRGSNGHFYDVAHGISVRYGLREQTVYFDVTAQVTGRNSALAAANSVTSTLP